MSPSIAATRNHTLDVAVIAALILESQFVFPPDRLLQQRKERNGFFAPIPSGDVNINPLTRRFGVLTGRVRNRGEELDERGFGGLAQSEIVEQAGRTRQEESLNLGFVQAGQIGSILAQQRPSAARAS